MSLMMPVPPPNGSGGTEVLGSGKSEMPWARMHWETFTICATAWADGGGPEPGPRPPPGKSFWHVACAALNAGDARSIPALTWKPPPVGSGKLGTPLERMHLVYASNADWTSPG